MSLLQTVVGISYMFCSAAFVPIYIWIIYIYLSKKSYRMMECFQIMIHIGNVQCAMGPGVFLFGLMQVINFDPWYIDDYFMRVMSPAVRMEAVMSFVLALNRLRVICDLKYPQSIHTAILLLAWVLGCTQYVLLYTPWFGYDAYPGIFSSHYDRSKPYSIVLQQLGSYVMVTSFGLSLAVYTAIMIYLIRLRTKVGLRTNFEIEMHILVYAGVRFVVDISLAITFNYGHLPAIPIADFPIMLGYVLNNFFLPPFLYLALNRTLRHEFFKKTSSLNMSVWASSRLQSFRTAGSSYMTTNA